VRKPSARKTFRRGAACTCVGGLAAASPSVRIRAIVIPIAAAPRPRELKSSSDIAAEHPHTWSRARGHSKE
jgi:hypothetical protein